MKSHLKIYEILYKTVIRAKPLHIISINWKGLLKFMIELKTKYYLFLKNMSFKKRFDIL